MEANGNEVLTAKADQEVDGEAQPKPRKKNRRTLWIVLGVLGLCLVCGLGAIAGAGVTYGLTRARSRVLVRPGVHMWTLPRQVQPRDLPIRPDMGLMGMETGALLVEVVPDGPADKAGLREGDVLLSLDGTDLDLDSDLASLIAKYGPGDEVTFAVAELGGRLLGESREVTVVLAEHPEAEGKAYLGVTFVPLPDHMEGYGGRWFQFEHFEDDHSDDDDDALRPRFRFYFPNRGS